MTRCNSLSPLPLLCGFVWFIQLELVVGIEASACEKKKLLEPENTQLTLTGRLSRIRDKSNVWCGHRLYFIRLIPGLETGSRAPYMLVALCSRHDVALHVEEEWLASASFSKRAGD